MAKAIQKKKLTEQGFEADCLHPTLRAGSRQRLKPGVWVQHEVA
jgi:hypothetical protein